MKPVTIGLVGVGFHARTVHIPAYDLMSELRFMALATSREQTAKSTAERFRVRGYADYRELVKSADIEAVVICTPGEKFAEVCRAALEAGKHVFLETPGIQDQAAAAELQALANAKGLVIQVGFLNRYSPLFDIIKVRMDVCPSPRILAFEYYPFLSHTYNLALYLSGEVDCVLSSTRDIAGSVDTVRFKNGDTAVIVGRSLVNCSVNIESFRVSSNNFYGSVEGRTRVRIIENMQPKAIEDWSVQSSADTGYHPHVFTARYLEQSGTIPMLRAFVRAIREGIQPRSTLKDSVETGSLMRAIEGCRRAAGR